MLQDGSVSSRQPAVDLLDRLDIGSLSTTRFTIQGEVSAGNLDDQAIPIDKSTADIAMVFDRDDEVWPACPLDHNGGCIANLRQGLWRPVRKQAPLVEDGDLVAKRRLVWIAVS